jgi:glutamine synthetase
MALLSLDDCAARRHAGEIDTVLLCLADMQGRLQGKRLMARHFVDDVVSHGAEACNYLLAVDVEMNTVDGYAMSSWEKGYGDFEMKPDFDTLRRIPWHEGAALCMADLHWATAARRRLAAPDPARAARPARRARASRPSAPPSSSSSSSATPTTRPAGSATATSRRPTSTTSTTRCSAPSRVEPLIRRIRNGMTGAGMQVENSKGECNFGQHEINFTYGPVLRTADEHTIYKNGAKEIADQEGMAITYMAKFDEREGNSCHIHLSLQREDGSALFAEDDARSTLPRRPARRARGAVPVLRARTSTPTSASPSARSRRRRRLGQRQPHLRPARGRPRRGRGSSCGCRAPTSTRTWRSPAIIAAGPARDRERARSSSRRFEGNAYASDKRHVPRTLRDARDAFAASSLAREAFGQDVVDHYLNNAPDRARGVRRGRHRLGAGPGVRAVVKLRPQRRGGDAVRSRPLADGV